jgi:uncharacterized protein YbjT (DUF2867 family)
MADTSGKPPRVLLVGATGLIGSAVAARLRRAGCRVTALVRTHGPAAQRLPVDRVVEADLRRMTDAQAWAPLVEGIDAVVNCAGVLQQGGRDSPAAVHVEAPRALYRSCEAAGVRRVIHFSAMGADQQGLSEFSRSKGAIEQILAASSLDWVVLRPSVVVGRPAYGGSALFRALASLPLLPRQRGAGRLSVVQLDDVAETVVRLLRPGTPERLVLDLAGPEALAFEEVVGRYRAWLGWRPARVIDWLAPLMGLAFRLGDVAGRFGWRPPIRSTARHELARGAAGDPRAWTEAAGLVPQRLGDALAAEPASAQERWFARLFVLRPLGIVVFALFWILTGVLSLTAGWHIGVALMAEGGAGRLSAPSVVAGALADLVIGFALLWRRTAKPALWAALAITLFYLAAGTAILPRLWVEPLGPLLKTLPILMFNLMLLAILEER